MSHHEKANAITTQDASVIRGGAPHLDLGGMIDRLEATGRYEVICVGPDGKEKWRDDIKNVVMTEGKNTAFNAFLAGSSYTVTGPYMGLISSVGFTATAAGDTAAQINGSNQWTEANTASNAPTFTGNRKTCVWASASGGAIALSAALSFAITSTGTVEGAFIIFGASASATPGNTSGALWSGGVFTGGAKAVANGDTLNVSYSTSM
jgi:hypothetical protein